MIGTYHKRYSRVGSSRPEAALEWNLIVLLSRQ
jgi:hypothetical protein